MTLESLVIGPRCPEKMHLQHPNFSVPILLIYGLVHHVHLSSLYNKHGTFPTETVTQYTHYTRQLVAAVRQPAVTSRTAGLTCLLVSCAHSLCHYLVNPVTHYTLPGLSRHRGQQNNPPCFSDDVSEPTNHCHIVPTEAVLWPAILPLTVSDQALASKHYTSVQTTL